ncbi:MAG TPA: HD domain-containing protein [Spirochaetota bacterium]|nr:HD domain-containing protein [Spirochaetota bacterium]HPS87731.1 HD domain-containing protein [Spirochaetota bacterium]
MDVKFGENCTSEQIESISSVFDNFGDYMIIYGIDGEILHINSNLLVTLDYSKEEIKSKKINNLLFSWNEENTKDAFEYLNYTDRQVFRGSFLRRSGDKIPIKAKNTRIIYQGVSAIISVSHDISVDLDIERTEREKFRILRENLGGVILAIANAVEVRDSYTAGHQQRVSNLARKIANQMELSPQTIEGIRIAASIHDIGKIAIPSDILNKSRHLLEVEFELIKHHTNIGFQILSTIDFPWPVAAIILQHHEYIDGSGYPLGLDGSMMLLEAKVVCVADVVEAMSTHRPYRPALGIEAAIEEINRFKGIRFDSDVVDACTELYKNGDIDFNLHSISKQNKGKRFF